MTTAFGIDIGGSGIKGARVDLERGRLLEERIRIVTPQPATPTAISETVAKVAETAQWEGAVGCAFPAVVQHGVVHNATNIDKSWIGVDAGRQFSDQLGVSVTIVNDADAAGLAEMQFGAGLEFRKRGVVVLLTFGTGIGSAIFTNGTLCPNSELGDLQLDGQAAELLAAGRLREEEVIGWDEWISRVEKYLKRVEALFWPDLIIFGGGISEQHEMFLPRIETRTRVVPAALRNNAGIVGAALVANPALH